MCCMRARIHSQQRTTHSIDARARLVITAESIQTLQSHGQSQCSARRGDGCVLYSRSMSKVPLSAAGATRAAEIAHSACDWRASATGTRRGSSAARVHTRPVCVLVCTDTSQTARCSCSTRRGAHRTLVHRVYTDAISAAGGRTRMRSIAELSAAQVSNADRVISTQKLAPVAPDGPRAHAGCVTGVSSQCLC